MGYPITGASGAVVSVTNPLPVVSVPGGSSGVAATLSSVATNVAAVTLKASNVSRRGLIITNISSVAILYVKCASLLASPATVTDYQYALPAMVGGIPSVLELPFGYTGEVNGIWSAADASGTAKIAEFT